MWQELLATIAGTAMQKYANDRAASKQQAAIRRMQQQQLAARDQATGEVMKNVAEFDPTTRQQRQTQIEHDLTGQLAQQAAAPQITAQGVQVGSTLPAGQGGADYLQAKAREQQRVQASLRELASLMGRMGSATELRRNEAIGFGDTAGAVQRIQGNANNMGEIDMIGIDRAGQASPGLMVAGEALRGYGLGRMAGAGAKPKLDPIGGWLRTGSGGD